jgi:DNA-directed RNA polymerase subunit RPC12/RpoP
MAQYCGNCGAKLRDPEAKFCSECGSKVISSLPTTTGEEKVQRHPQETRTNPLPQTTAPAVKINPAAEISPSACAKCHGTGFITETTQVRCSACGGSGWTRRWEHHLPTGITSPPKPPIMVTTPCVRCGGRGYDQKVTSVTCPACRGRGG